MRKLTKKQKIVGGTIGVIALLGLIGSGEEVSTSDPYVRPADPEKVRVVEQVVETDTADVEKEDFSGEILEDEPVEVVQEVIPEVQEPEIVEVETISEPEPDPEPIFVSDGRKWYVSSHWSSEFYYCEESDGWQGLSEKYLEVYDSEAELKSHFPRQKLHESCY